MPRRRRALWLVDPSLPSVQVFALADGAYLLSAEGAGDAAVAATERVAVGVIPAELLDR